VRSRVHLALGLFGAGCAGVGLWVWWKSTAGPGDDNPIALAGLGAAALALVPSWGLVLWARRRALRAHLLWLFFAGLAAVPLTAGLLLLWSIIRRGMP
jgi:hypothetical protein